MAKNDFMLNGQQSAFPTIGEHSHMLEGGLTKREYFAAMAMQGILAHSTNYMGGDPKEAAKDSIKCADELLKQLES